MTLVSGFTDATSGGSSGSPKTGDLSAAITAGSTDAFLQIKNTGEDICNLYFRKTGTSDYTLVQLNPESSQIVLLSLTAARTMEYYFDAGELQVDVAYFWGTGLSSTVSLTDVTNWVTMCGYTVGASGDITSAQIQLCLDIATSEVTMAASRFLLIAGQALSADFKNAIILKGAVAQVLYALRNKGAAEGRTAQAIAVNNATAETYMIEFKTAVDKISMGIYYGA